MRLTGELQVGLTALDVIQTPGVTDVTSTMLGSQYSQTPFMVRCEHLLERHTTTTYQHRTNMIACKRCLPSFCCCVRTLNTGAAQVAHLLDWGCKGVHSCGDERGDTCDGVPENYHHALLSLVPVRRATAVAGVHWYT